MRVIGTAGHVDHGKSTLIEALTGTHPDRLKEEQEREMTIDLGFGWLTLPGGEEIAIIDVPGHRDFIENMLAGVGGIDTVVLVVAADEGMMPQTREHLAIVDLLRVPGGVVALTKTDLITDAAWLEAVEADVRNSVKGTVLEGAPIVRVSARTRDGLDDLLREIRRVLEGCPTPRDLGKPRLPVDRVFTMTGFGTVVTGTLVDGVLKVGDEVEILPRGLRGRVRGLQNHGRKTDAGAAGARTAVNLIGVAAEDLSRGDTLTRPGLYQTTMRVDAHLRLLADASTALRHHAEVKVFAGSSETMAVLRILNAEELAPGQSAWVQLDLREPLVMVRGDRFIIRRPSPAETLGGGVIADAHPKGRHRRFEETTIATLESLLGGAPTEVLFEAAHSARWASVREIIDQSRLPQDSANRALLQLVEDGRLILLEEQAIGQDGGTPALARPAWEDLERRVLELVGRYHSNHPLRIGMPREELKSQVGVPPRVFQGAVSKMAAEGTLVLHERMVALPMHQVRFDTRQEASVTKLLREFEQEPYGPPSLKACREIAGEEIVDALLEAGQLVAVSSEVVFRKQEYDEMVGRVRRALDSRGQITLAEVRDLFGTSRKYAQALLEHLDVIGLTRRAGDARVLVHRTGATT